MNKTKELTRKAVCSGIKDILISDINARYTQKVKTVERACEDLETGKIDACFLLELLELCERYGVIKGNA